LDDLGLGEGDVVPTDAGHHVRSGLRAGIAQEGSDPLREHGDAVRVRDDELDRAVHVAGDDVVISGPSALGVSVDVVMSLSYGKLLTYYAQNAWVSQEGTGFCEVQLDDDGDGDFDDKGDRWALNPVSLLADKVMPAPHRGR
jgi:hypothetical protein